MESKLKSPFGWIFAIIAGMIQTCSPTDSWSDYPEEDAPDWKIEEAYPEPEIEEEEEIFFDIEEYEIDAPPPPPPPPKPAPKPAPKKDDGERLSTPELLPRQNAEPEYGVGDPPPPPRPYEENSVFTIVETMPHFKGCEDIEDKVERRLCSDRKIREFIGANIAYPEIARESAIEGTAIIRFVVETDGSLSAITILRDPGGGTGEEAKRVISLMPNWNPGISKGKPVRVQFTLPVKFSLG